MKIAWTAYVLDGGRTGIATYIFSLLKALSAVDRSNAYDILLSEGSQRLMPPLADNFRLVPSSNLIENPLVNIVWHNTALPLSTRREKYDLIHVPSFRRIPLVKSCPIIATVHDMAPHAMPDKYDAARIFYHRQILARLIHRCDHVITVSHYTKADIIRYTGYPENQITVIYSGIDRETFHPLPREEALAELQRRYKIHAPFIVYVSRVEHPAKNQLTLIKAFELFKQRHDTSHHLVLAGPPWSGHEVVDQYVRGSKLASSIHLLGSIPREDIVRLYSTCDFMAFSSLFEGFGFPLLEAMACGAPVICSNTTSLGELAKDYAKTFDPTDPEAICTAMESAASPQDRQAIVERGMTYASTFNWTNTANEVLGVYQRFDRNK